MYRISPDMESTSHLIVSVLITLTTVGFGEVYHAASIKAGCDIDFPSGKCQILRIIRNDPDLKSACTVIHFVMDIGKLSIERCEGMDHCRVKVLPGAFHDDLAAFLVGEGSFVRALGPQGVIDI